MKGAKAKTVCPIFENSKYPYHGIGVKLGDPFAITYKYYASKKFSIVADLGKASSGLYNRYFAEKFYEELERKTFTTVRLLETIPQSKMDLIGEVNFIITSVCRADLSRPSVLSRGRVGMEEH